MSDAAAEMVEKTEKSRKSPLILGLVLAAMGAGGGYFAVGSGLIPGLTQDDPEIVTEQAVEALPDIGFVELDPIMVSFPDDRVVQHLRFRASLEVNVAHQREVESILPRVIDVMNGYLRALELSDFQDPLALVRLRAQLLRRIQIVAGQGRVRDVLIVDFVLN